MATTEYDRVDLEGDQDAFIGSLTEEEKAWGKNHNYVPTSEEILVYCNRYDITSLVTELTWSGSKNDVARKLDIHVVSDDNYHFPDFEVKMHDTVQFFLNGVEVFRGYVMDVDRSINDKTISYICYDGGIFLTKSKGKYNISGEKPEDVVRKVCKDFNVPLKEVQPGESYQRIHNNDSLYDIIMTGYTLTSQSNGKQYYLTFKNGALNVLEKGEVVYKYALSSERELSEAKFHSSSLNAVNRVKAYSSDGTEVGTFELDTEKDFPGILQAIYKQSGGEPVEVSAKALLKDIELTASVEGLGITECVSGTAVVVSEPVTGLDGLFYIDSDTHKFENGLHTMSLDIAFENIMDQVTAGQVEQATDGSTGYSGVGGNTVQERVYNFLRAQGFSAAAACGVMGNIEQESGFNATIQEYGSGVGYGLCQWSYARRTNLINWCQRNGQDYTTVEGQLNYLMYELKGGDSTCVQLMNQYCGGLEGFKKLTDVAQATRIFQTCFERAGVVNMSARIAAAQSFYNKWKNYTQIPAAGPANGSTAGATGTANTSMMPIYAGMYALAYPLPNARNISAFTYPGHTHHARDFQPPNSKWGTPVVSVLDGVVKVAGNGVEDWSYGNSVYIDHGGGWMSRYAHLNSINVRAGQAIKKGQVIGGCGSSGNSSGLHLHLELHSPWGWIDPGPIFSNNGYVWLTGSE